MGCHLGCYLRSDGRTTTTNNHPKNQYVPTNPDVSCERACMPTEDNEYFTDIIDTLKRYQDCHGQILSSKKLKEAVLRVMDEEEEEMKRNIQNDSAK